MKLTADRKFDEGLGHKTKLMADPTNQRSKFASSFENKEFSLKTFNIQQILFWPSDI